MKTGVHLQGELVAAGLHRADGDEGPQAEVAQVDDVASRTAEQRLRRKIVYRNVPESVAADGLKGNRPNAHRLAVVLHAHELHTVESAVDVPAECAKCKVLAGRVVLVVSRNRGQRDLAQHMVGAVQGWIRY